VSGDGTKTDCDRNTMKMHVVGWGRHGLRKTGMVRDGQKVDLVQHTIESTDTVTQSKRHRGALIVRLSPSTFSVQAIAQS